MSVYDYIVIAFYLGFVFLLGPIFKSFSKTASDFYRCGGGLVWWIAGSSTFMTTFTAWSFTGGAAKAYETGTFFLLLYLCNFLVLIFTYFFTAARFRQMRVVTETEAVRKRYGNVNEQVFTWLPIFTTLILGGIYLYTISVFISSIFPDIDTIYLILGLGGVVMLMTLIGGSWAAIAGDFIQILIVLTITIVMAFLTIQRPEVGGSVSELVSRLPERHFNWTLFDRSGVILFFAITLLLNQLIQNNSMSTTGGAKYIFAKDGKDAKKASLVSIFGFLLLPWIWMIPALAATLVHPNLAAEFPGLKHPNEAAYVSMAITLLPKGLLGLLICAIFAGTLTTLCSYLNLASGTFVRNFYIRKIDKDTSEARQIKIGRIIIFFNGIIWMVVGWYCSTLKDVPLFDLLLRASGAIGIPATITLFYGIFVRKTPPWSAWSTMVVGIVFSTILLIVLDKDFFNTIMPGKNFNAQEVKDMIIGTTYGVLFIICSAWFFATKLFYKEDNKEYVKQVDAFFKEMKTPVDRVAEHSGDLSNDVRQYVVIGNLCLIYSSFVLLLMLIPGNSFKARMCILFCGATIAIAGGIIRLTGTRLRKKLMQEDTR